MSLHCADPSAVDAPVVDPRGLRFAAVATSSVLVLVLLTGSAGLLAAQAVVFALGLADHSPYSLVFRRFVRPRLGPPAELEDARPPRFAQAMGLLFAVLGVAGFALGSDLVALTATAAALVAAFLNAAFGVCVGCELYLLIRRAYPRRAVHEHTTTLHKEVST